MIGFVSQATLDPGDEVVTGWPSFPSYVLDPLKLGAAPVRVPLRDHRLDLEAMLDAVTPRTKLVFIAAPNNPTGTTSTRATSSMPTSTRVPPHVLTVVDQAYFEYVEEPDYPDAIEEYAKAGRRVLVLRTFSKIYGLAGLRVGYGVGPEDVITAIGKVRRAFDVSSAGAGGGAREPRRRLRRSRRRRVRESRGHAASRRGARAVRPRAGRSRRCELPLRRGRRRAPRSTEALLRRGVIVRPLRAFGAPDALRITAGTPDEIAFLGDALDAVLPAGAAGPSRPTG